MAIVLGQLSLIPSHVCISVYSPFSGDDTGINKTRLEFRPQGLGRWLAGHPLALDLRSQLVGVQLSRSGAAQTIPNPWGKQWRGSIVGLIPGITYDVRVTYTDPNGVSNAVQGSVTTISETIPVGNQVVIVATNGSDANGTGSLANPFATIPYAVGKGDRIMCRGGTYPGGFSISKSGLATAYLSIEGYQDEPAVVSGGSIGAALKANYLQLLKMRMTGMSGYAVQASGALHHLVLDKIIADTRWFQFVGSGGSALGIPNGPSDVDIRYCELSDPGGTTIEVSGMHFMDTGGRYRVYRNHIHSKGQMKDGIGGTDNDDIYDGCHRDSDIYENIIDGVGDDCVESEGGQMNIREWGNHLSGSVASAFGHAAVSLGPVYDFRNLIQNIRNTIWKTGGGNNYSVSDGAVFLYHNTIFVALPTSADGIAGFGNTRNFRNWTALNNIFRVSKYYLEYLQAAGGHVLDYNSIYSESPTAGSGHFCAKLDIGSYTNFTTFKAATGFESHGMVAVTRFADPANGDLSLLAGSPEIDKGVLIPNFNDQDSAWPYSGAGPDMGAIEYGQVVPPAPPVARFSFSPASGMAPLVVAFTNLSSGAIDRDLWDFGDGSTSSEVNPVHTYINPGSYTTKLTVTGPGGSNTLAAATVVTVQSPPPPPPQYALVISVQGQGTTDPAPGSYTYISGDQVTISAKAVPGWRFSNWTGDITSSNPDLSFAIGKDMQLTAVFVLVTYTLTMAMLGMGSIAPDVGSHIYPEGDVVTVAAAPAAKWQFDHWEGPVADTAAAISTVTMDGDKSVHAIFTRIKKHVHIAATVGGTTNLAPGDYEIPQGDAIEISNLPDAGYEFVSWQYDGQLSTDQVLKLDVETDLDILANFAPVIVPPTQFVVTVSAGPGGTTRPTPGAHPVDAGTLFTVAAIAAPGYVFDRWQLDLPVDDNPLSFNVVANVSVAAVFKAAPPAAGSPVSAVLGLSMVLGTVVVAAMVKKR